MNDELTDSAVVCYIDVGGIETQTYLSHQSFSPNRPQASCMCYRNWERLTDNYYDTKIAFKSIY